MNNKCKQVLSLLGVLLLLGTAPMANLFGLSDLLIIRANAATYSGTCGANSNSSNVTWDLDTSTGNMIISGSGAMRDYSRELSYPDGNYVSNAPWYRYSQYIKALTVKSGVTKIGSYAFYNCYNLTSVEIESGLTIVGDNAFFNCRALENLVSPNSVTSIGNGAFAGCVSLPSIPISNNLRTIGNDAFGSCKGLSVVSLPNTVTGLGEEAFSNCEGLTSVTLSSGMSTIKHAAFSGCINLEHVSMPNSIRSIESYAFNGCKKLTDAALSSGISSIGDYAFYKCESLASITIPEQVTTIGTAAFEGCSNLSSVTFNAIKCESTGGYSYHPSAFGGLKSIKTLTFGPKVTIIPANVFASCTGITEITIPENVTTLGVDAFYACKGLRKVTFNAIECTKSIGSGTDAFDACEQIDTILIGKNVKVIPDGLFYCNSVESVVIPEGVTKIEHWAFMGCKKLLSVTLPSSLTSLGLTKYVEGSGTTEYPSFTNCPRLSDIYYTGTKSQYNTLYKSMNTKDREFMRTRTIHTVDRALGDSLKWECMPDKTQLYIAGSGAMPDFSESNPAPWAEYKSQIKSVQIANGVTSIGANAFSGCTYLTDASIPSSIKCVGSGAFKGTALSVTHPEQIPATKTHSFGNWAQTKAPTVYAEGIETRICATCGCKDTRSIAKLPTPIITINNYTPSTQTYDYRTSITFSASVENAIPGGTIRWFVNGHDQYSTGETFTYTEARSSFSIQAKYMDGKTVLSESEAEKVNVNSGFFARIKAFFRALFGGLPKVVQTYLGVERTSQN